MNFITILVMFTFSYYLMYFISLIFAPRRKQIIERNTKLDNLRKISFKTLDEQKEFLNTKFPKSIGQKRNWPQIIMTSLLFLGLVLLIRFLFVHFEVSFDWGSGLIIIIGTMLVINFVLRQYRLQNTDIDIFFKW